MKINTLAARVFLLSSLLAAASLETYSRSENECWLTTSRESSHLHKNAPVLCVDKITQKERKKKKTDGFQSGKIP